MNANNGPAPFEFDSLPGDNSPQGPPVGAIPKDATPAQDAGAAANAQPPAADPPKRRGPKPGNKRGPKAGTAEPAPVQASAGNPAEDRAKRKQIAAADRVRKVMAAIDLLGSLDRSDVEYIIGLFK